MLMMVQRDSELSLLLPDSWTALHSEDDVSGGLIKHWLLLRYSA
jgi:hypothetical protein